MTNISLPDLVAERIKNSELGQIIKEEDLYDIAKTAMEKAFFEKREVRDGYNTKTIAPLAVEIAEKSFKEAMDEAMKPVVAKLVDSEEFRTALTSAIQTQMPHVMNSYGYGAVLSAIQQTHSTNMDNLKRTIETNAPFYIMETTPTSAIK